MFVFKYFAEKKLTFTYLYGEVTSVELNNIIDKLHSIKLEEGGMRGLTIITENTKPSGIKTKDIMHMGERMHKLSFRKNGKNVFITNTILAYAFTRIFKLVMDTLNIDKMKIYKGDALLQALTWLELTEMEEIINDIINSCESQHH
jgi:hypothetical protein